MRNVYWNLILASSLSRFRKGVEKYLKNMDPFLIYHAIYLSRKLLEEGSCDRVTPLDLAFQLVYSKQELAEMVQSAKDKIDLYITQHNLHEIQLHGFTAKTIQWLMAYYIIRRLKEMNPSTAIVMGGIINESQARAFMNAFNLLDYVIWGEGEYPLLSLTAALEKDTLEEVPNLVYRENNKIVHTEFVHEHPSLDSFPFADHSDYFETFQKYIVGPDLSDFIRTYGKYGSDSIPVVIPLWGSRSCPWNRCRFCTLNEGYTYRARSPENIIEEIEFQSKKHDIYNFFFMDTDVSGNLKRFKSILKLIMKIQAAHGIRYRFFGEVSPLFITDETAHYMQLGSFDTVQIGFEATTDSMLQKMDKRHRFVHNIRGLKLGDRYGLALQGLNVIRGIPTETREDVIESCINLRFLRFFLHKYALIPISLRLDKNAYFYNDVSEEERKEWIHNPVYAEIEPLNLIPQENKFEFFGFSKQYQDRFWNEFRSLMNFYVEQAQTYEWVEFEGGSFVEEKGLKVYKYTFDRIETDLLIFCDEIRSFSEVREKFPHTHEGELRKMLHAMKNLGIVYYDDDMHSIISILDATKRKLLVPG